MMDYKSFIDEQISHIRNVIGNSKAINALSGGVDSSVLTVLGHRALGDQLRTVFVDSALMRDGEPERVVEIFAGLGIRVELVDAREEFLSALAGLTDPEEKRRAVTDTFYSKVFARLVKESQAKFLLHGTILTDIEETVAGIKRQHNILAQLGICEKTVFARLPNFWSYRLKSPVEFPSPVRVWRRELSAKWRLSVWKWSVPQPLSWKKNWLIAGPFNIWLFCLATGRPASATTNVNSGTLSLCAA
ncbi:MAG: hypothetical protein ACYTBJ_20460 [Planctomycetota bacterium]|jgi:hypothetical protein